LTLISILLPARDAEPTLEAALESIAAQTHRDWELLAVDDGSQDGTPAILERWGRRESRLRVVTIPRDLTPGPFPAREGESPGHTRNQGSDGLRHPSPSRGGVGGEVPHGIVTALNAALAAARGPVVARMDADDISLPTRLERQLALLAAGGAEVVGCQVRYFPDESVAEGARRYEAWLNSLVTPEEHERDLFIECPLAHPTLMLPRALLEAAGGYRARGWPEDYDLLLRLWRRGARLAKVPEPLFLWRESPGRTSRTHADYRAEAFRRCKAHHLRRSYLAGDRPALVWGGGPFGKLLARELLVLGTPLRGFVDLSPRRIGQVIYGAPVLSQPEAFQLRGQAFGLAAVGQSGARDEIRAAMAAAGWIETVDFCCAA
jgi:glycosyltransferase involved in cell wall biosynthesis